MVVIEQTGRLKLGVRNVDPVVGLRLWLVTVAVRLTVTFVVMARWSATGVQVAEWRQYQGQQ